MQIQRKFAKWHTMISMLLKLPSPTSFPEVLNLSVVRTHESMGWAQSLNMILIPWSSWTHENNKLSNAETTNNQFRETVEWATSTSISKWVYDNLDHASHQFLQVIHTILIIKSHQTDLKQDITRSQIRVCACCGTTTIAPQGAYKSPWRQLFDAKMKITAAHATRQWQLDHEEPIYPIESTITWPYNGIRNTDHSHNCINSLNMQLFVIGLIPNNP